MQSSREVIDNLLRRGAADRIGLNDSPWDDTLRKWVAQGYPVDERGDPVPPDEHFGFDLAGVGGLFDIMPIRGVEEIVEETDEWAVKRNGAGALLKWWKNKSGTPEHVGFRMTSREIWDRDYRPHLLGTDRSRLDIESTKTALSRKRAERRWTHYGHLFIWENMRRSMGDVTLYENMLLDPGWIHDYCRVHTDFSKTHYRILFEEAGIPDGIWVYEDLGYRNGLFCSPKTFAQLIFPYFTELVEFFHSYGLPVVLHTCGGIREALPLIVEAGFDALHPMEVKAGCDALEFAAGYKDRLAFIGGLDARVLESGDRVLIQSEVVRLIEGMKSLGARYVFGSDHSLSTNVRYDDFRFALDIYRKHMLY